MPTFSAASLKQLATCDKRLQAILKEAIKYADFTVLEGHRGQAAQDAAYAKGNSKLRWPFGNHNKFPSRAVDIAPFPIDWDSKTASISRFAFVSGIVWKCAVDQKVKIRFGWDWNRNLDNRDEGFTDWPHVELDEP